MKEKLKKKTFRSAFIETFMSKLKNIIQEKGNIFTALNDTTISQQIKAIKNLLKTTINKPQLASLDPLALQRSFVTLLRKINIDTLKSRLNSKKKTISKLKTKRSKRYIYTARGKIGKSLSLTRKKITLSDRRAKSLSNKYLKSELLENDYRDSICAVCCEPLINRENITTFSLSCNHKFHTKCIDKWFTDQCNTICPICRQEDENYTIVDRSNCKQEDEDSSDEENSDEENDIDEEVMNNNNKAMKAIFGGIILIQVLLICSGIIVSVF